MANNQGKTTQGNLSILARPMLFLVVVLTVYGITPAHGYLSDGQGCYCHNFGIGININGTDYGRGYGVNNLIIWPGGSAHLIVTSCEVTALSPVPYQEWNSNLGDNSNFVFSPQIVYDNSPQDLNGANGTVTALYTITAPSSLKSGWYTIVVSAQGADIPLWPSVTGTPVPEFDNATLILTFSTIVVTMALVVTRALLTRDVRYGSDKLEKKMS